MQDVINPIFEYAAREPTIPYSRFNDWLQVGPYPDQVGGTNGYFYDHEEDAI